MRRSRRTMEDILPRCIMRLVTVFILETHNQMSNNCLPKFVQTDIRELKQRQQLKIIISLFHLCYFTIISTHSTFAKMASYPGTKLVGVAYKSRKKMKNSMSYVLHKTLNLVISRCCFAEDGKEMYQNVI